MLQPNCPSRGLSRSTFREFCNSVTKRSRIIVFSFKRITLRARGEIEVLYFRFNTTKRRTNWGKYKELESKETKGRTKGSTLAGMTRGAALSWLTCSEPVTEVSFTKLRREYYLFQNARTSLTLKSYWKILMTSIRTKMLLFHRSFWFFVCMFVCLYVFFCFVISEKT